MKYKAILSPMQVGQAVRSLLMLGEREIRIIRLDGERYGVETIRELPRPNWDALGVHDDAR